MRLTKKDITIVIENKLPFLLPRVVGKRLTVKILTEMLEYKDIEEELGIDIKVFYTMTCKYAVVYKKDQDGIWEQPPAVYNCSLNAKAFCLDIMNKLCPLFYFKDYGKTWALTKQELE